MGDQKNLFLAIALALGVLAIYQYLVVEPAARQKRATLKAQQELVISQEAAIPAGEKLARQVSDQALKNSARLVVDNDALDGSITQYGLRFDNLHLKNYSQELEPESQQVQVLSDKLARGGEHAEFGWRAADAGANNTLPGATTEWKLVSGSQLANGNDLVFAWTSPENMTFTRRLSVDDKYMFTITDTVNNAGAQSRTIRPYGRVQKIGDPSRIPKTATPEEKRKLRGSFVSHQGIIGAIGGENIKYSFKKIRKGGGTKAGANGWIGFTSKYWLAALIAPAGEIVETSTKMLPAINGEDVFEAVLMAQPHEIKPGGTATTSMQFFAGAKELKTLQTYQAEKNIERFDMAIDWGLFWFLTRPYFFALDWLNNIVGNFGIAILLLTVAIKAALFPIANKSYESMARMKALQPKMEELKERLKGDQQKIQQETMELYKREKVNPFGGCLPILLQIPIFFALYKTLYISIEMRHAPFFGWIKDLSAPDPTAIGNLFGLIPWDPVNVPIIGAVLAIGIWPLLMGLTMGAQQLLNPPAPDPMQRKIFAFMPVIFTIMLAPFAAGLVIYWAWNNFLSLIQQYIITRKNGVETPLDKFLGGNKN